MAAQSFALTAAWYRASRAPTVAASSAVGSLPPEKPADAIPAAASAGTANSHFDRMGSLSSPRRAAGDGARHSRARDATAPPRRGAPARSLPRRRHDPPGHVLPLGRGTRGSDEGGERRLEPVEHAGHPEAGAPPDQRA